MMKRLSVLTGLLLLFTVMAPAYAAGVTASALPDQDWLMTEEIPARISSLLKKLEIAVPEGRTPRAFVSFRAPKPVGANGAPNGSEPAEEHPCE